MSYLKGIKSIGGYVSTPVDKVEYTGIDYLNPAGKVISTVIIDQDKRTIAVDVKELSSVPVSLLDPQPLSTVNDDYILLCTVNNGSRRYEWISYGDLLNRITADEESIKELRENLIEEINRAKSIEEEINNKLTKEISRAIKAEEDLKKQIDDETSSRIDADNNLTNSLNEEIDRATSAENILTTNLNKEIGRAEKAAEDLNSRINNLDYSSDNLTPAETISQITQTDGLISVTKQSIQIEMNQVTGLNDEFSSVRNEFKEADNQLNEELSDKISTEATNRENADTLIRESISEINSKIPEQASSTNQLADKDFVNSSISTSTATFRGTYDSLDELKNAEEAKKADNNDYAFVKTIIQTAIEKYDKYTYVATTPEYNPDNWTWEYTLNNSSFTEAQWKAINSNITEDLTLQITTNKNNIESHIANKENPHEVTKAQIGLDKVDNTSDEDKPVSTATQNALDDLNTSLTKYVDDLIKSMGTLTGTLEEGTLIIGPGDQVSN